MVEGVDEEPPVVARCVDQRQPQDGDPVCVVCGRFGAYVCDGTDEDVCSLQCRDLCLLRQQERGREVAALRKRLGIRIGAGNVVATTTVTGSADTKRELEHWPAPLVDFVQSQGEMRLPAELVTNMTGNKFERPTPVQMQTIPCVLLGHNVLVSAPTGSGKTASYLIPIISQILATRAQEESEASRSALVLAPIRELAMQIEGVAKLLMCGIPNMKTALLVGGFPVPTQRYRLQCGIQLIVATPGRFLDIFTNYAGGDVILEEIRTCVIDEVDVMLDVGFRSQISQIVALLSPVNEQRSQHGGVQILLFSATISDEVEMLVQQTLKTQSEQSYLRIEVGGNSSKASRDESSAAFPMNAGIQQRVRWTEDKGKKKELFTFLTEKHEESTLVFVSSRIGATMLAEAIEKRCGIRAAAIHADKSQADRLAVLEAFVTLEVPVLVSTNVLSRGMDLLHVQNVVIFDFPKKVANYVHLIGRVRRGETSNDNALVLVNQESRSLFRELIPLLRRTKTPVPREIYQSLHSEEAKQRAQSNQVVIDESKRAFRVRKQLDDESGVEWKQWDSQCDKRQRTGF